MPKNVPPPTAEELAATLGRAQTVWDAIVARLGESVAPLELEWRASKSAFGLMCLLRHKKRTLLYLTPEAGSITAAIVLGARAVEQALASDLPEEIKALIRDATPYVEGRGIRWTVTNEADIHTITSLVAMKTGVA